MSWLDGSTELLLLSLECFKKALCSCESLISLAITFLWGNIAYHFVITTHHSSTLKSHAKALR